MISKNHKFLLLLSVLLVFGLIHFSGLNAQIPAHLQENDQCIVCHLEIEFMPEDFQEYDIHLQQGLSCVGCHGGDATSPDQEEAMDPSKGFIGIPARTEIPQFCGKCHSDIGFMRTYQPRIPTDQVQQYYTSIHGQKLQQNDNKVAECASCHTAHAITSANDARSTVYPTNVPNTCRTCHSDANYMESYSLPTDQYEKYAASVHGVALLENKDTGSPACNDCHGNHGATPPGVESISHVCGSCHINNMDYFTSSPMAEVFSQLDYHACEQCHGNHAVQPTFDDMVGTGENAVCIDCHSSGEKGYQAAEQINEALTELVSGYNNALNKFKEVQIKGMDDVDILFLLQEAKQDLIHSRTIVHTFRPEEVKKKTNEGLTKVNQAKELAVQEIEEFQTRRIGFGISTLFITLLVIALYFKIRQMEREK